MKKVQCSFCSSIFTADEIIHKHICHRLMKALPESIINSEHLKRDEDNILGQFCPECNKLHVIGFKEINCRK